MPAGSAFVTGATGFIGRHLIAALLESDREVIALCREKPESKLFSHPQLKVILGDLGHPQEFTQYLSKNTSVFNLAAARNFPDTPNERFQYINVDQTLRLGQVALEHEIARFVHVSTALVFGPMSNGCQDEGGEWDWRSSESSYVRSRADAQVGMMDLMRSGLPVVIACPTIVYGPDHPSHPNRLTDQMRRLLKTRLDIVIAGGQQQRDLSYIDDVVHGILLGERHGRIGEAYILGGEQCSHRRFNQVVLKLAGRTPFLRSSIPESLVGLQAKLMDTLRGNNKGSGYCSALQLMIQEWCYTSAKAETELGYLPRPISEGLQKTVNYLLSK